MEVNIGGYKDRKYTTLITNDKDLAEGIYAINKYTAVMIELINRDTNERLYQVEWRK